MQNIAKLFGFFMLLALIGCNQSTEVVKSRSTFEVLNYREAMRRSVNDGKRVVIMFSADWCIPCKKMKEVLREKEVRRALADYHFTIVDRDTELPLCNKHDVKGLPTFLIIDSNGREIKRFVGYKPARSLIRWLR